MTTREIIGTFIVALAFFVWLVTLSQCVEAVPELTVDNYLDTRADSTGYVNAFRVPEAPKQVYCAAGTYASTSVNAIKVALDNQPGETYVQTWNRLKDEIITQPLTTDQQAMCNELAGIYGVEWVVEQYRTYPDRPVKRIVQDVDGVPTVDTSDTIGRINHGEPCAEEIFSGTSYMWRRVTITYPDGTAVDGAAVCGKQ